MPPNIQPPSRAVACILRCKKLPRTTRHYATAAAAITPAASHEQIHQSIPPLSLHSANQPPSFKPAEFRKTQLLRQYASILRSTPLMLLFQHNNLKSSEWVAIRRELAQALRKVDEARIAEGHPALNVADGIKIQIVQTGIFAAALRVVEFFKPKAQKLPKQMDPTDPSTPSSATIPVIGKGDSLPHSLSEAAYKATRNKKAAHALAPLLTGPVLLLTFPAVSPQHLKVALSILSPSAPNFPAPTRKANPGWHDPPVQSGISKLLLLAARVEGKVFDADGAKWVGTIAGGLEGLRGQLVAMLQGFAGGLTNTLESAGKSLYFTVEGRKTQLEEEEKGPEEAKKEDPKAG